MHIPRGCDKELLQAHVIYLSADGETFKASSESCLSRLIRLFGSLPEHKFVTSNLETCNLNSYCEEINSYSERVLLKTYPIYTAANKP